MMKNLKNNSKAGNSPENNETPKIVLYARISREKREGITDVSLDNQIDTGHRYATLNGYTVIGEYREIQSAKKASNRPQFMEAIALAKKEKAILFLHAMSRGFRSTVDAIVISQELEKSGANLVSHSENIESQTPSGKLFFTMITAMAQFEREMIASRTKDALTHKKNKGEKLGGRVPFGFRVTKNSPKLIPIKSEQKTITRILNLRLEGLSLRRIGEALSREKITSKLGGEWHPNVIRRIIREARKRQSMQVSEGKGDANQMGRFWVGMAYPDNWT